MVYADMGVFNSFTTRRQIGLLSNETTFIWHVGDISYADDAFTHAPLTFGFEKTWNDYLQWFQNVSAGIPTMTCPGNHEAECHSLVCMLNSTRLHALNNFTAYNARFRMPSSESGGTEAMWYSFDYGFVHYVSIDTETDYPGAPNDNYTGLLNGGFGDQVG
jgi:acid phosphatase type 7